MKLIANNNPTQMIQNVSEIIQKPSSKFIEANTSEVTLEHIKKDCIIPVFAKDNETTISHYEFIDATKEVAQSLFSNEISRPAIRVSHQIKGRIPSAIGKPVKELKDHEKTIYYERMAFMMKVPQRQVVVNNQILNLTIGGVRAYNQENLFSKKSIEKFKVFIGFKNTVCTNLCISTDGLKSEIRVSSISELQEAIHHLIMNYNEEAHLGNLEKLSKYHLKESEFAHLVGKMKMYHFLNKRGKQGKFPLQLTDSQISIVVKDYFTDDNFSRNKNEMIDLWNVYNLFTGANKSSYIDNCLERNVNAYEFMQNISNSIETETYNWFLHNYNIAIS
ncbi:DUF3871 family protein [Tenacibaculum singaporense]|uniref:DUF3871 family protein n=1 Tax=Tenacibaculum singaporense TaxID=2358479 RepID=A0A3S8R637_9FLAO|nr:DUF3871 family protein [Tenacibaculum singaporense]AZJ35251.1 DUF3871 family protein [Tenacibaculum singaporense]